MDKKFDNIPAQSNSSILLLARVQAKLDKYLVCLQIEAWGKSRLTSLILVTKEIAHLSDKDIIHLIQNSRYYDEGRIDINHGAEYTNIDFNIFIEELEEYW